MADKLHVLLGSGARKYIPSFFSSTMLQAPNFAMSGYTPTPTAGIYQTVVSVVGGGRLRGVYLLGMNGASGLAEITLRLTIDGLVISKSMSIVSGALGYISLSSMVFYNGSGYSVGISDEIGFDSNMTIEVMRSVETVGLSLYELHEMEA